LVSSISGVVITGLGSRVGLATIESGVDSVEVGPRLVFVASGVFELHPRRVLRTATRMIIVIHSRGLFRSIVLCPVDLEIKPECLSSDPDR
jgi:hypothetical protein